MEADAGGVRAPRRSPATSPRNTATTASSWSRSRRTTLLQGRAAARRPAQVRRGRRRHPGPRREGRPLPDVRPGANCQIDRGKPSSRAQPSCCAARRSSWRCTRSATSGRQAGRGAHPAAARARRRPSPCTSSRDDVRAELDRPLTSSLMPTAPTPRPSRCRPTAGSVDRATSEPVPLHAHRLELQPGRLPRAGALHARGRPQAAEAAEGPAEAGRGRERGDARRPASGG